MKLIYRKSMKEINNRLVEVNLKFLQDPDNVYILDEKKRLEKLLQNISTEIKNANVEALKLLNGELTNVFYLNYNYGVYLAEQLSGYDLEKIIFNREILKKMIADNYNPFTKIALNEIKDKSKIYRELKRVFLQATIQGDSISQLAKAIQKVMDKNYYQAVRIARTETTRIQNLGRQESFKESEKLGLKVKKQWISTVDSRTRKDHLRMNLETTDVDGKFSNGLEYPGDLKGGASQVINCRCTHTIEYEGIDEDNKLKELDQSIKDMTFEEWVKRYGV